MEWRLLFKHVPKHMFQLMSQLHLSHNLIGLFELHLLEAIGERLDALNK